MDPTATAGASSPTAATLLDGYRARRHGPQGGRRGQRRHPVLDRRSCSAATTAIRSSSRSRRPRRRSSSRTSARATYQNHGRRVVEGQRLMQAVERHLPRLGPGSTGSRRRRARLLRAPALGREDLGADRPRWSPRSSRSTARCARRRWLAPTPAPGDRIAIAAYLGSRRRRSTGRWPSSRSRTPSRTQRDYEAVSEASRDGRISVAPSRAWSAGQRGSSPMTVARIMRRTAGK